MSWQALNIDVSRITSHGKTTCPQCSEKRQKKNEPCLSVDIENEVFYCHHCGWNGSLKQKRYSLPNDYGHELTPKTITYFQSRGISLETLQKMQITEGLTFIDNAERNTIHFNYFRNGILINIKYRDGKKRFKMFKNAELIFYNLDAIKDAKEVIFVEGEIDCLSFIEVGLDFCISVPNGASDKLGHMADSWKYFENKEKIYVCVDKDEAGKKLENELVRRFGKDKCYIIDFPFKDANECLVNAGKEELLWAYKEAKLLPLDDIQYAKSFKETMLKQFDFGREHGTTTYIKSLDEHFTWKKGQVSLFHGIGNFGKSIFVYNLCVLKSDKEGDKWGIFSPEHFPANEFYDNLIHTYLGKDIDVRYNPRASKQEYEQAIDWVNEHFYYIYPEHASPTPQYINKKFEELIIRHGITGAIIDPFNQLDNDMSKFGRDDLYISDFLTNEKRFAQQHDIYKIIIAHPKTMHRNATGGYDCPSIYDLHGGSMWVNKCDNILAIHSPNWHKDKADTTRLIDIQKIKTQLLVGLPGEIKLEFNRKSNRYTELIDF